MHHKQSNIFNPQRPVEPTP